MFQAERINKQHVTIQWQLNACGDLRKGSAWPKHEHQKFRSNRRSQRGTYLNGNMLKGFLV
jgi:hypothetical protein